MAESACGFRSRRDSSPVPQARAQLTNGFGKKLDNLKAAVALHFAHYNMVRIRRTLRVTSAMAAGVSDRLWTLTELVEQTSR